MYFATMCLPVQRRSDFIVNRLIYWVIFGSMLLMAACKAPAPPTVIPEGNTATQIPTERTVSPVTPVPEAYPALPAPEGASTGYPLVPVPEGGAAAAPTGYPAQIELVWILKPVGEQCAAQGDALNLQTAVADLIAIGVEVGQMEMVQLEVCQGCGCPTAAHFRVQVPQNLLSRTAVLGWTEE